MTHQQSGKIPDKLGKLSTHDTNLWKLFLVTKIYSFSVPSSPPRNLLVLNVSSRSVLLQWDDPPQQDWNGQLSGYTVLVREFNTENSEQRLFASRDPSTFTQVHNVTNLKTYTQYIFSVSAKNSVGGSSYSNEVQVRTTEDGR